MKTQLTVRIPEAVADAVESLARRSGLKRSDIVRAALVEYTGNHQTMVTTRPFDLVADLLGRAHSSPDSAGPETRRALIKEIRDRASRPA